MDLSAATCASPKRGSPIPGAGQHDRRADVSPGVEATTPTKRNKRKMSEPRRLTDFSVHNLCKDRDNSPEAVPKSKKRRNCDMGPDKNGNIPKRKSQNIKGNDNMKPTTSVNQDVGPMVHPAFAVPGFAMPMAVPVIPGYPVASYPTFPGGIPNGAPPNGALPPGRPTSVPPSPTESTASSESTKPSNSSNKRKSPATSHSLNNNNIHSDAGKKRKNYKNMTRERRIEANARERSRVHLISAAFENLRRAVPSYSYNQRLSKLAILRIACSYIISLAKLADQDYSQDSSNLSFSECVDLCTRTIQTEGRARRRH